MKYLINNNNIQKNSSMMKLKTQQKRIQRLKEQINDLRQKKQEYLDGKYFRTEPRWNLRADKTEKRYLRKIEELENTPVKKISNWDDPDFIKTYYREYSKKRVKKVQKVNIIVPSEKKCSRCRLVKQACEFTTNNSVKSGLNSMCRVCLRENYGWKSNEELKLKYYEKYGKFETYEDLLEWREKADERRKKKRDEYINSWGSGVYLITTTKEETYVGFSIRLRTRRDHHNSKKIRPDSCIAGIHKMKEFKILEQTKDKSREQYWIEKLNPTLNQRNALVSKTSPYV